MPNLQDINEIVEIAQGIGEASVLVVPKRCVAVINRNAKCKRCVEACQTDAITVGNNMLKLNTLNCMGCGACTSVCPVEALVPLAPTDHELTNAIRRAIPEAQGSAVFACARIAARGEVDPDGFAEVPCLARMQESLLLELIADGAQAVQLVDGNCATCKYGACDATIASCIESANALLEAQGCSSRVERLHAFPPSIAKRSGSAEDYGASRRAFFEQAGRSARQTATQAAKLAIRNEKKKKSMTGHLLDRLGIDIDDPDPLPAIRHENLVNAMDAVGEPSAESVTSRDFGMVVIDKEKCTSCAICANFCPTDALRRSTQELPDGGVAFMEFDAYLCVQCNMCQDICFRSCLTLEPSVALCDLFNFEPLLFRKPNRTARDKGLNFLGRATN